HLALWILLYLAVTGIGGKTPEFRDAESSSNPPQPIVPVARLEDLLSPGIWPKSLLDSNSFSPFFTRHFIPPPSTRPPPPTIREGELFYQGFFETEGRPKQTIIKIADAFTRVPMGASVVTNWFIADATALSLTLTNPAGQTNILLLNTKKELEIPIK